MGDLAGPVAVIALKGSVRGRFEPGSMQPPIKKLEQDVARPASPSDTSVVG